MPNFNIDFKNEFETYLNKFDTLKELSEGSIEKALRIFDIRFRLSLNLKHSFSINDLGYLKTEETRETYKLILQLCDYWFVFESFLTLLKHEELVKVNTSKTDLFTKEIEELFFVNIIIDNFNLEIFRYSNKSTKSRNDLLNLMSSIHQSPNCKGNQKVNMESIVKKFEKSNNFNLKDILTLVYALRNQYVHNGDTAKTGVSYYITKQTLVFLLNNALIKIIFQISNYILDRKIHNYNNL